MSRTRRFSEINVDYADPVDEFYAGGHAVTVTATLDGAFREAPDPRGL